jgi:hypothetical protein
MNRGSPLTTPGTSVKIPYVSTDADEMVKSVTTSPEQIAVSVDWPPLTLRFRNPPEAERPVGKVEPENSKVVVLAYSWASARGAAARERIRIDAENIVIQEMCYVDVRRNGQPDSEQLTASSCYVVLLRQSSIIAAGFSSFYNCPV